MRRCKCKFRGLKYSAVLCIQAVPGTIAGIFEDAGEIGKSKTCRAIHPRGAGVEFGRKKADFCDVTSKTSRTPWKMQRNHSLKWIGNEVYNLWKGTIQAVTQSENLDFWLYAYSDRRQMVRADLYTVETGKISRQYIIERKDELYWKQKFLARLPSCLERSIRFPYKRI